MRTTELGIDRRTLAKRLSDLPPAEQKRQRGKTVKRWHLADALAHLNRRGTTDNTHDPFEVFKKTVAKELYHNILASDAFTKIIVNGVSEELGVNTADGLRALQIAGTALAWALCEVLEDDDLQFSVPDYVAELGELGPEAYLEKHPIAAA